MFYEWSFSPATEAMQTQPVTTNACRAPSRGQVIINISIFRESVASPEETPPPLHKEGRTGGTSGPVPSSRLPTSLLPGSPRAPPILPGPGRLQEMSLRAAEVSRQRRDLRARAGPGAKARPRTPLEVNPLDPAGPGQRSTVTGGGWGGR